ncbi:uncharacterized protein F5Z01DRAFT_678393 [Emericellopsis atlantica]|uniref:Aconitate hydratase, mitochondrial n=1 Tax=Emericellopsis atlantica TaxID=2614577 RepID=A0A9P8CKC9_9HYPO|nr:uncharacterized protein F5Z01DRAFT_678393 [Emericellopsis atlantica]KAG9249810.1 hypothetical protein F5Z01DRAFT_678393 [Emericellopsis atlantica]
MAPLERHHVLDYGARLQALQRVGGIAQRPLTLSEKLLYSHLIHEHDEWSLGDIERGQTILRLRPDRVACHDATATMALLQFISAGLPRVQVPTSIHSDHLIVAEHGAEQDLERASSDHREVYSFLASASKKYGIGYWKAGAGIIHTTIFENYAFPGGLMIGTDSHTPNAGGMGMLGIGVGGSDAVDAMAGLPWELVCPKVIGIHITGELQGWSSSKDIICKLAGILSVSGGKGKILEFFGPGVRTLGATAMATICNMSAEVGSTSCIFPYSESMGRYLSATKRDNIARYAESFKETLLTADEGSDQYYDDVIHIDLTTLEPHINGPFTPDLHHPLSQFKAHIRESSWPSNISHSMVGSCTNSSYEDLEKVHNLVQQAKNAGMSRPKTPFLVSPGSEQIRATAEDAGILGGLRDAGAVVLSNSFNRNFTGRHDGNPATHSFVTSPEIATAFAYAGDLSFNPSTDSITVVGDSGATTEFRFTPPTAQELPDAFIAGNDLYQAPVLENTGQYRVEIDENSDRLELLEPFPAWMDGRASEMQVLVKVAGKCTTDHISPAGPWYNYRGHLTNISHNMLLGASNSFLPENTSLDMIGKTKDPADGELKLIHEAARNMKNKGLKWCIIGDNNYGEGSSREHAALEPRFLGGTAVIAKSFARIHETNLKKQGMLPLTFDDPADYDKIREGDVITVLGVDGKELQPENGVAVLPGSFNRSVFDAPHESVTSDEDLTDANIFLNQTQFIAYDKKFFDIIGPKAKVNHVQTLAFQTHEAPCYNSDTKQLFFVEWGPPGGEKGVHSWQYMLDTATNELRNITTDPPTINAHGCVIYNKRMYVVTDGGPKETGQLVKIDPKTLKKEVLLNNFYQQPFLGFNYLDVDRQGNFWLTDSKSGYGRDIVPFANPTNPTVYRVDGKTMRPKVVHITTGNANGVAIADSEHGQVIYLPDTGVSEFKPVSQKNAFGNRGLYAFDVGQNGILTNQRLLNNPIGYFYDGLRVSRNGWIFAGAGDGVDVIDPGTGLALGTIRIGGGENVALEQQIAKVKI